MRPNSTALCGSVQSVPVRSVFVPSSARLLSVSTYAPLIALLPLPLCSLSALPARAHGGREPEFPVARRRLDIDPAHGRRIYDDGAGARTVEEQKCRSMKQAWRATASGG
jgi:hypothetical protein